jgi:hypothetical protein
VRQEVLIGKKEQEGIDEQETTETTEKGLPVARSFSLFSPLVPRGAGFEESFLWNISDSSELL